MSGRRLRGLGPRLALFALVGWMGGCAVGSTGLQPRGLAPEQLPIDLERFAGSWYVLAHIPTPPEVGAAEAVERYELEPDGDIAVRFAFCEDGVDGPPRELRMRAWVHDAETRAEWRVRPFWPLALRYQIQELDPAYTRTVIVHPAGGHAWLMAREPRLDEAWFEAVSARLAVEGYDTALLRRIPHDDGRCASGA